MKKEKRTKKTKTAGIVATIILIFVLTVGISCTVFLVWISKNVDTGVDGIIEKTKSGILPTSIYYQNKDGTYSLYEGQFLSDGSNRAYAEYEEIPEMLINAFISIEDKRFRSHIGVDFVTSAKAAFKYFIPGTRSPGGSTITQQLIKNITGDDEYSVKRKIGEMLRAVNLERALTKEEIITAYLNNIYLSENTYGVKAASKLYFDKELSELDLAECACIASITQSPTKWDPILNPENNKIRRDTVIYEMYEQGYIGKEEFDEYYGSDIELNVNKTSLKSVQTSWYTDTVISEAITLLSEKYDISSKKASEMLYNNGYRIICPMDPEIQSIIEKYYENDLFSGAQSSFIVTDPINGYILGIAGGTGEKIGNRILNRATDSKRQPGSSIKPLSVYAPAIDSGLINYASIYDDTPYTFGDGNYSSLWPHNVNGKYKGLCTIEYAVSHSVNTVAVKILSEYGIGKAYDFLKNELSLDTITDGEIIDGNLYNDLSLSSLALGGMTYGVTLKDMVSAYSIFPSEGIYKKATSVLKIYDRNGDLIIDNTPKGKRVIEKDTAEIMNQLLKSVVYDEGGTANPYIDKLIEYTEVAGKTGTTSSNIDRWFIGYTPHLASGVWVGYDMNSSLSNVESGLHVRVFDDIMTEIYEKKGDYYFREFSKARIVEGSFCMDSGKIVTDSCVCDPRGSRIANGYFKYGDLPYESCDIHKKVRYCLKGKGVAGENCPDEDCVYFGMISYNREMPYDITVTDSEYLYFDIDEKDILYSQYLPFFQYVFEDGKYPGKFPGEIPFNRFCSYHFYILN